MAAANAITPTIESRNKESILQRLGSVFVFAKKHPQSEDLANQSKHGVSGDPNRRPALLTGGAASADMRNSFRPSARYPRDGNADHISWHESEGFGACMRNLARMSGPACAAR
jgi:hypothetical protein